MGDRFNAAAGRTRAAVWALMLMLAALSFAAAPAGAASPNTEGPMYAIAIEGDGPISTGSAGSPADADVHAQRLVETLAQQGHAITRADFVVHGRALDLRGRTLPTAPVASERVVVGLDVAVDSVEGLRAVVDTLRVDRDTALSDCSTAADDELYACRTIALAPLEAALRGEVAPHVAVDSVGAPGSMDQAPEPFTSDARLADVGVRQAYAMASVCLDLHDTVGVKFGDDPYAAIEALSADRDAWEQKAAQENRNVEYFRGLVDTIGAHFGEAARTADDGSVGDSILRAKVPELVAAALAERDELRVENARLVAESASIARELTALQERDRQANEAKVRPRRSGAAT